MAGNDREILIRFDGVTRRFGSMVAVDELSLDIRFPVPISQTVIPGATASASKISSAWRKASGVGRAFIGFSSRVLATAACSP